MRGIDVSKHNGVIDFEKVKAAGIDFVIIRAGYGRQVEQRDTMFEKNYQRARAAGLKIGAYWYSYAKDPAGALIEAKTCQAVIRGKRFDFPIYYDVEENDVLSLGNAVCSNIVKTFCDEMERAGYWVGLYSFRSALQNSFSAAVTKRYAVWVAEWGSKTKYTGQYGMWQYSSTGRVPGINGHVDMNEAFVDYPELIMKKGLNGFENGAPVVEIVKGAKIALENVGLFTSSTANKPKKKINGTYYVYDGIKLNGRIRITNDSANVGKKPIANYVTGWIETDDVM